MPENMTPRERAQRLVDAWALGTIGGSVELLIAISAAIEAAVADYRTLLAEQSNRADEAIAMIESEREQHEMEIEKALAQAEELRREFDRSKGLLAEVAGHIAIKSGMSPAYAAEVRRQIDALFLSQDAALSAISPGLDQVRREAKIEALEDAARDADALNHSEGPAWAYVYEGQAAQWLRARAAEPRKESER